jgi:hypothetical protein
MTWDYRVLSTPGPNGYGKRWYAIHEVYYRDDGTIDSWTEKSIEAAGGTPEELREDLEWMLRAFAKPVLRIEDLRSQPL